MPEIQIAFGIVGVFLTFVGYIPYIRHILKGKTRPHIYSWFLWGFVTTIAFALQMSDKAGAGAFVTLAAALMCLVVFLLGLFVHGQKDIARIDTVFLVFALFALLLWLFAKQPIVSSILTSTIDILGFLPTIRKSWKSPYSETASFYFLNTLRFSLSLLALQRFTLLTASYPIVWLLGNGLFALMLLMRRKQLGGEVGSILQDTNKEGKRVKSSLVSEKRTIRSTLVSRP